MNPKHSFSDYGPPRDPLDVAAEAAARHLFLGEPMQPIDWEALQAKAAVELREYDLTERF